MPDISRSDADVAFAARSNPEEFRELYHRYAESIYRFVRYRVHTDHDTQDIVSDVFFKALKNIRRYDSRYAFSTWITTIARNTIIDYWRTQKMVIDLDKIEHLASEQPSLDEYTDTTMHIDHMMNQLSEGERILITLRFEEDLSFQDMARVTGKSEGSLRTALHRLKKKMQSYA